MTIKFKVNQPVIATGSRGLTTAGRFVKVRDMGPGKGKGSWIDVNVAEKGKPAVIKSYRPVSVAAA